MTQQNRSLFRFEEITELHNVTDIADISMCMQMLTIADEGVRRVLKTPEIG